MISGRTADKEAEFPRAVVQMACFPWAAWPRRQEVLVYSLHPVLQAGYAARGYMCSDGGPLRLDLPQKQTLRQGFKSK